MRRTHTRAMLLFCLPAFLLACFALPSFGQLSKYDKSTLIDGMRDQGMRELLKHFAETELGGDPILQKQVLLSQYMLDYRDHLTGGDMQAAVDAFQQAVDTAAALVAEHHDHEQRPIWQTQLAESILLESLSAMHRNADRFYEFGVPTEDQARIFAAAAVQALELTEEADVRFYSLQTDLPKEPDHTEKRIDTGLWNRMIEEFYSVRTQFMLAHAAYYTSLLPDSNPYFQKLGSNPRVIRQKKTIDEERKRLVALARERLETLITTGKGSTWNIEPSCQSLLGRVLTAQGKPAEGLDQLTKATAGNTGDAQDFWAHLGIAWAHAKAGRDSEALTRLKDDMSHPMASTNLLLKLLVVDARHRIMLQTAQKKTGPERANAVAEAYRPYLELLDDPSLGETREGLREFIHRRWVSTIDPKADMTQIPSVVVAAIGRTLRIDGQNQTIEARQQEDPDLAKQAKEKLARAHALTTDLLKRTDLLPPVRAEVMFNQAIAMYFLNQEDVSKILGAANIMVELADKFPDQAVGREAITSAVAGVLHPLHAMTTPVVGAPEAYRRAVDVLLAKYPTLPAATNERFYFAMRVLVPAGELDRALEVLAAIPADHVNYYEAQREMLYARMAQFRKTPTPEAKQKLDADARELEAQAQSAATGEHAAVTLNVAGHARLIQADLAALDGNVDQAVSLLSVFEQDYGADTELIREALGRRIAMLARAGRFDQVSAEADKMMKRFPEDAAPIIDRVLTDLDTLSGQVRQQLAEEIIERKQEELKQRIAALSETARKLAQLLVDWAVGQKLSDNDMVPYRLILARSMRLAGKPDEAMGVLEPLNRTFPDDSEIMHETAETLFAEGSRDALVRASGIYTALIEGLPMDEQGKYPRRYFNAWMRFFQINEKLNENTTDIALTIRQLQMTDPNVGGEPYKSEMERLLNKYSR